MRTPLILQIAGYKNTGKTTLTAKLITRFKADGRRVAVIKHDGHGFQLDRPGTDTWQHQQAGADTVVITSPQHTAWLMNQPASLDALLAQLQNYEVVLVEGFKNEPFPKLVMIREPQHYELLSILPGIIAAVVWPEAGGAGTANKAAAIAAASDLPCFAPDEIDRLYLFVNDVLFQT